MLVCIDLYVLSRNECVVVEVGFQPGDERFWTVQAENSAAASVGRVSTPAGLVED
jgi:hypothetical protein